MNAALVVALLLAGAVVLGVLRTLQATRYRLARIGLQIAAALLSYCCLFPPATNEDFSADELVVVTPGAARAQLATLPAAATIVALPGVDADKVIERVPDLGTALRVHAGARRLRVVGSGLPMRDRDVARGHVATFAAAPLPRGLVELDAPASVRAGNIWRVDGRVEAVTDGRVELHDPSGAVVAAQALDTQGRFALHANAKGEGTALFTLKAFDRDGAVVDSVTVPLAVRNGSPLKIVLLAGAPDAELKYLRRWAADAGLELTSQIALSDGVALSEGTPATDEAAWREADIAIVDERTWAALAAPRKQVLIAAVHDGLGLLLRVTGPLPAAVASDWADLGFRVRAADAPTSVALDKTLGLGDSGLAFARHEFAVEAGDAAPLLRADDGSALAWSRNLDRGRVALWLLADSYRLALAGSVPAYGTLWGGTLATVARARGEEDPSRSGSARVDERVVFCGIGADAAVVDERNTRSPLGIDERGCAAHWPELAGWHALLDGNRRWPFYVRAHDEATGLAAGESQRATRALLGVPLSTSVTATRSQPLARWPFFLALLAALTALWWLERSSAATGVAIDA